MCSINRLSSEQERQNMHDVHHPQMIDAFCILSGEYFKCQRILQFPKKSSCNKKICKM
uniref:Uncharacterized protein n=1 Tax=Arundo donax TaxID=35708 RepID=A0A0A9BGU5_ARUDO